MTLSVASPLLSRAKGHGDSNEVRSLYYETTDALVRLTAPLALFFFIFAEDVLYLFGPEFSAGHEALRILCMAGLLNAGCGIVGNVMNMTNLENELYRIYLGGLLATLLLLPPLVYFFGINGAAACTLINVAINNLLPLSVVRRKLDIHWAKLPYRRWVLPTFVSLLCTMGMTTITPGPASAWSLLFFLILTVLSFHFIYLLNGLSPIDRVFLTSLLSRFKGTSGLDDKDKHNSGGPVSDSTFQS